MFFTGFALCIWDYSNSKQVKQYAENLTAKLQNSNYKSHLIWVILIGNNIEKTA